jgi:hypothetical protein
VGKGKRREVNTEGRQKEMGKEQKLEVYTAR